MCRRDGLIDLKTLSSEEPVYHTHTHTSVGEVLSPKAPCGTFNKATMGVEWASIGYLMDVVHSINPRSTK